MTKKFLSLNSELIIDHFSKTQEMRRLDIKLMEDHGVDIYAQGNRQTMMFQIVAQNTFDVTFSCNYLKHGVDAVGKVGQTEIKSYKAKPANVSQYGSFSFHANGDLSHANYSFVIWDGNSIVRFYNISDPKKVGAVETHLGAEREKWMSGGGNKKNDVIRIPEAKIAELFSGEQLYRVSAPDFTSPTVCQPVKTKIDGDIRASQPGEIRYYSDY